MICAQFTEKPGGFGRKLSSAEQNVSQIYVKLPVSAPRATSTPYLQLPTAQLFAYFQSCVHSPLQVPLQPSAKVPEHGGASRQHDILCHNTK